jgi:transposase
MQSNTLNFNGQKIFIGIDVHLKSWNVSIFTSNVKMKPFSQSPDAVALRTHLDRNFPGGDYFSAYESGFCGFSVHYDLLRCGIKNIVFNAADITDSHKERARKADSVDSAKIARNLRDGNLTPIHVPSQEDLSDRQLLRTRRSLVKNQSQTKIRIKSFLNFYGIKCPLSLECNGTHWSQRFINWVKYEFGNMADSQRKSGMFLLRTLEFQHAEVLSATRELRDLMRSPKYEKNMRLLTSVPGVGLIAAATFLLEIGDISRFSNSDHLASFIGLVPDTRSSGEKDAKIGITNRSNRYVREALIEGAWRAIRKDPALTLAYEELRKRMEPNKAIIRIARKLANRIMCVLRTQEPYVPAVIK